MIPEIKFFIVNKDREHKELQIIYEEKLKEIKDYHNNYGKDGFLSERTYEAKLEQTAKRLTDIEYNDQDIKLLVEKIIIIDNDQNMIKNIETRPDFVKWLS